MNIVIICSHTDCMYNKQEIFVYYGEQSTCTFSHPVFYKYGLDRKCVSKTIKHIPNVNNQNKTKR